MGIFFDSEDELEGLLELEAAHASQEDPAALDPTRTDTEDTEAEPGRKYTLGASDRGEDLESVGGSGGSFAEGVPLGPSEIYDSRSDDSVQNEPERIDWDALQAEFTEFKDNLAIATGVGSKRRRRHRQPRAAGRPKVNRLREVRQPTLSEAAKADIGRINFLYANRSYDEAAALCHKRIAADPSIPDPWVALAHIYDETGDKERALNFFLVAAFIVKFDVSLWKQAGDVSRELGKLDQAIFCYTQASNSEPKDVEALEKRLSAALESKQPWMILRSYLRILRVKPYDMEVVKALMKLAQEAKLALRYQKALDEALEYHLKLCQKPECFDYDDLNLATELAIIEGDYMKAMRRIHRGHLILTQGAQPEWDEEGILLSEIVNLVLPLLNSGLPLQLKVKLGVLLTLLKFSSQGKQFLTSLYSLPAADHTDLYYEVASILAMKEQHEAALEVLGELELRHPGAYSIDLLLARAGSYYKLDQAETAIQLLKQAEELDPSNPAPKSALSIIYEELGHEGLSLGYFAKVREIQRSLPIAKVRPAPPTYSLKWPLQPRLTWRGGSLNTSDINLVLGKGHFEYRLRTDNSHTVNKLLARLTAVANRDGKDSLRQYFVLAFELYREFVRRRAEIGRVLSKENEMECALSLPEIEAQLRFPLSSFGLRQVTLCKIQLLHWLVLFTHVALTLTRHDRAADAQQVLVNVEKAGVLRPFKQARFYLCMLTMSVAEELGDHTASTDILRYMACESNSCYPGDICALYMAVMALGRSKNPAFGSNTNYRYFHRMFTRVEQKGASYNFQAACLYLLGHMACSNRNFANSLTFFFKAYTHFPEDPAICLSIAIALLHVALQRITTNRHLQILQSFTYLLHYAKLRGFNQEVRYNFGRAFHRLALFNLAVPHYEAALAFSDRSDQLVRQGLYDSPDVLPLIRISGLKPPSTSP
ncbi:transcription factor TFIIIC subunit tfc4 [Massospora cicadina]|nr:transcription factor TFIIIC subunit tfc4 [Massospora cicadina]